MREYKILKKKMLESHEKFERRINDMAGKGWRVVNIATDASGYLIAMLEKNDVSNIPY